MESARTHRNPAMAGVTAIHMVFAVTIFAVLFTGFAGVTGGTSRYFSRQSERGNLARRGMLAIEMLTGLVRCADGESFIADPLGTTKLPDGSVTEIQLRRVSGLNSDLTATLSEVTRIRWRPAQGEQVDGYDNNGNKMIDEGELVVIRADGAERVMARGVPQQGLRFKDTGDGFVNLYLTLMGKPTVDGDPPIVRVFETRVSLR